MRAHPDTEILRLESVSKRFGEPQLLDAVSLTIHAGERVVLLGESGSGKSTLLNLVAGLEPVDGGRILVGGVPVDGRDPDRAAGLRRERIGFVFQAFHLVPRLSAADNIGLPMVLAGVAPDARKARVHEVLESLDLLDRAHHRPDQLSGGQRQRVAIGRAIVMQPGVLLADEPTGNLDQHAGGEVVGLLERLNDAGITLIVVTHDPVIGRRARRRIRMVDGQIESDKSGDAHT